MSDSDYQSFYDKKRDDKYPTDYTYREAKDSPVYKILTAFIEKYHLSDKKCLEIGSSGGAFQDMVDDYTGTDVSHGVASNYHKPYRVADGKRYPFDDESFDVIWTFHVYEHIPHLQEAMLEIERLLKPGGLVLFKPAWQCRSWAADGYQVRPYSDFGLKGKLIKALIPIRNSIIWRSAFIFPKRVVRHIRFVLGYKYEMIRYKKIKANYEIYWLTDSDACNHIDAHDAILWFASHGFECLSHPLHLRAFMVQGGGVVLKKNNDMDGLPRDRGEEVVLNSSGDQ